MFSFFISIILPVSRTAEHYDQAMTVLVPIKPACETRWPPWTLNDGNPASLLEKKLNLCSPKFGDWISGWSPSGWFWFWRIDPFPQTSAGTFSLSHTGGTDCVHFVFSYFAAEPGWSWCEQNLFWYFLMGTSVRPWSVHQAHDCPLRLCHLVRIWCWAHSSFTFLRIWFPGSKKLLTFAALLLRMTRFDSILPLSLSVLAAFLWFALQMVILEPD